MLRSVEKNRPPLWKQQFLRGRHNDRRNILSWNAGPDPRPDRMGAGSWRPGIITNADRTRRVDNLRDRREIDNF